MDFIAILWKLQVQSICECEAPGWLCFCSPASRSKCETLLTEPSDLHFVVIFSFTFTLTCVK